MATADGFLYVYSLNTNEGGECILLKTHKLCGPDSDQTDWTDGKPGLTSPRDVVYNKGKNKENMFQNILNIYLIKLVLFC